ncbi:MAG: hypothetical protein LUE91_05280 [Oscillospiraceae bacterium]|nr:hypothetical protein [Oscillospiraceae bacterium]
MRLAAKIVRVTTFPITALRHVQSALTLSEEDKRRQEIHSLIRVADSFKKIVVVKDPIMPWHDENGILYLGIEDFLLNEAAMDS